MKSFSIDCYSKDKTLIGTQNVSMSNDEKDKHTIRFLNKKGDDLFILDTQNGELTLDNETGIFDALTPDKTIAKIKVSNIHLDYEDNLTFTLDGANNVYKISGDSILLKKGATFSPLINFENPLDIVFSNTLFDDIENKKLTTNGLPYQMFDALTDNSIDGLKQYQSENKLLHMVKYGSQLYIGRGHKLVPMNKQNSNMYKMGDSSVLGFTIGRNNGISGKQSSGIAFNLSEPELDLVSKFILDDEPATFKTAEDYRNNDIDYTKVYKQSDLSKSLDLDKDAHPQENQEKPDVNTDGDNGSNKDNQKHDKPKEDKPKEDKNDKASNDKNDKASNSENKPNNEKPKEEKANLNLAAWSTVGAFALGMLIISGVFVGPFAFFLFAVLFITAGICDTNFTITYYKKEKLSKEERQRQKFEKDKSRLTKNIEKNKSKLEKAIKKQRSLSEQVQAQIVDDNKLSKQTSKINAKIDQIKQNLANNVKQLNALENKKTVENNKTKEKEETDADISQQVNGYMDQLNKGEYPKKPDKKATQTKAKDDEKQDNASLMNDGETTTTNTENQDSFNESSEQAEQTSNISNTDNTENKDKSTSIKEDTIFVGNNDITPQQTIETQTYTAPTKTTNPIEENYEDVCKIISDAKASSISSPEDLDELFKKVNEAIKMVCPDGLSADKIDDKHKETFQKYVDYRNTYNYKELMQQSLSDCNKSTPLYQQYSYQLEEANKELKKQLSRIYNVNEANLGSSNNDTTKPQDGGIER